MKFWWASFQVDPLLTIEPLTLNLRYKFWLHATWIPKLGWLEYVFNTPSNHRVHHAANVEYLDANYGGVLVIFDRLFGNYMARMDRVKPPRNCGHGSAKLPRAKSRV